MRIYRFKDLIIKKVFVEKKKIEIIDEEVRIRKKKEKEINEIIGEKIGCNGKFEEIEGMEIRRRKLELEINERRKKGECVIKIRDLEIDKIGKKIEESMEKKWKGKNKRKLEKIEKVKRCVMNVKK